MDIMTQLRASNQPGVIPEPIVGLSTQLQQTVLPHNIPQPSSILSQLQTPSVNSPAVDQLTQIAQTLQNAVNSLLTTVSQIR